MRKGQLCFDFWVSGRGTFGAPARARRVPGTCGSGRRFAFCGSLGENPRMSPGPRAAVLGAMRAQTPLGGAAVPSLRARRGWMRGNALRSLKTRRRKSAGRASSLAVPLQGPAGTWELLKCPPCHPGIAHSAGARVPQTPLPFATCARFPLQTLVLDRISPKPSFLRLLVQDRCVDPGPARQRGSARSGRGCRASPRPLGAPPGPVLTSHSFAAELAPSFLPCFPLGRGHCSSRRLPWLSFPHRNRHL